MWLFNLIYVVHKPDGEERLCEKFSHLSQFRSTRSPPGMES